MTTAVTSEKDKQDTSSQSGELKLEPTSMFKRVGTDVTVEHGGG